VEVLVRARELRRRMCGIHRPQEARHLANQAERGFAFRVRGRLRTRGYARGSGRRGLLPGRIYGAVSDAELRTITVNYPVEFARVLILEWERRRTDGRKSDSFRTLEGRGRERATPGGIPSRFTSSGPRTSTPWSRGGTEFQLPPAAHDVSGVSSAAPQPVDSRRRLGPGHGRVASYSRVKG